MVKLRAKLVGVAGRVTRDAVRTVSLFAVEIAGAGTALDGVAHYSRPVAYILGGVAAIVAVERQPRSRAAIVADVEKALDALKSRAKP